MLGCRASSLRTVAVSVCLLSGIQLPAQSPQTSSPSKATVDVVFSASQKDGSPAPLTASDIAVYVDKEVAQVQSLRSAKDDPLLFAVLVDLSGSDTGAADSIRSAAVRVFGGLVKERNRGYLVLFSEMVAISRNPFDVAQVQKAMDTARFHGGTAVYDAIKETCIRQLSKSGNADTPRRVIIVISDGDDNASHIRHGDAESAAEQEGVPVFSMIIRSDSAAHGRLGSASHGREILKEISRNTGGIATDDLNNGVQQLLRAIDAQWALTIAPAQTPDHSLHSLHIKTEKKDIEISAPAHVFLP